MQKTIQIQESLLSSLLNENNQEDIIIMSDLSEITKLFVKEQVIIWYDPNYTDSEKSEFLTELQNQYQVKPFREWERALNCMKEMQIPFQLIISDLCFQPIDYLETMQKYTFLYLLTNKQENAIQLTNSFSQNIFIETSFEDILLRIGLNTKKWQRESSSLRVDFPAFASNFDDLDKSQMNHQHLYLKGLVNFQNRAQAKRDFLMLSKAIYQDIANIQKFEQSYNDYNMAGILKWYTKECFLYKVTNNCLRIASSDSIQYCRIILKDLETAIKEQYLKKSINFHGLLYRGAYISHEEWMKLQHNIGKEIEMYGFLSTSKLQGVALNFAKSDPQNKAFITIIIPKAVDKKEQGFAELKEFSDFVNEDEVLFNVRSRFTILEANYEMIGGLKIRHLVLLYGAQGIRRFLRESNPSIEIIIKDKEQLKCQICCLLEHEDIFIDLSDKENSSICGDCLENLYDKTKSLLFCLPKELNFPYQVKIEGMLTEFIFDDEIPFYGFECNECGQRRQKCYFRCLTCREKIKLLCKDCWKPHSDCRMEKHLFVLERSPFIFWSEKMSDKEFTHLEYQNKLSLKTNLFHQAETFYNSHDYAKAIQYYEKFLEKEENTDNKLLASLYNNLGLAYFNEGTLLKAIKCHLKALEIKKSIYGEQHAEVVISLNSLGAAYYSISDYPKAIEYHTKSFKIGKIINGANHPNTAVSYSNLAIIYKDLGAYNKAIEFNLKAYEIRKLALGEAHPLTAANFDNLGHIYSILGEYQKSKEFYEKALEAKLAVYGEKHPETAISFDNLGSVYIDIGELYKALDYHLKALDIRILVYGEEHQDTSDSYNNLGNLYYMLEEYHQAIEFHLKSLKIKKLKYGEKNPDVAISYNNLGLVYNSLGDYEKALENHLQDIEITKSVYGEDHPDTITSYDNLGVVYRNLKRYEEAMKIHKMCIEKREKIFGVQHPDTATSYYHLGLVYEQVKENKPAVDYLIKAIKIRQNVFGKEHKNTKLIFEKIQELLKKMQVK